MGGAKLPPAAVKEPPEPDIDGDCWYELDGSVAEGGADFWVGVVALVGAG